MFNSVKLNNSPSLEWTFYFNTNYELTTNIRIRNW